MLMLSGVASDAATHINHFWPPSSSVFVPARNATVPSTGPTIPPICVVALYSRYPTLGIVVATETTSWPTVRLYHGSCGMNVETGGGVVILASLSRMVAASTRHSRHLHRYSTPSRLQYLDDHRPCRLPRQVVPSQVPRNTSHDPRDRVSCGSTQEPTI